MNNRHRMPRSCSVQLQHRITERPTSTIASEVCRRCTRYPACIVSSRLAASRMNHSPRRHDTTPFSYRQYEVDAGSDCWSILHLIHGNLAPDFSELLAPVCRAGLAELVQGCDEVRPSRSLHSILYGIFVCIARRPGRNRGRSRGSADVLRRNTNMTSSIRSVGR